MKEKLLPIGSVIKKDSKQAMIIGYTVIESGESYKPVYEVVMHPIGYVGNDHIKVIEMDNIEVISRGYSPDGMENVLESLTMINDAISHMPKGEGGLG